MWSKSGEKKNEIESCGENRHLERVTNESRNAIVAADWIFNGASVKSPATIKVQLLENNKLIGFIYIHVRMTATAH